MNNGKNRKGDEKSQISVHYEIWLLLFAIFPAKYLVQPSSCLKDHQQTEIVKSSSKDCKDEHASLPIVSVTFIFYYLYRQISEK